MIRKMSRSAIVVAALALPLVLTTTTPAYAATAAVSVVTGGGTIGGSGLNAGLPFPNPQPYSFNGTGASVGVACSLPIAPGLANTTLAASGTDALGDVAVGEGDVNLDVDVTVYNALPLLTTSTCSVHLTGTFARAGAAVEVAVTGGTYVGHGTCAFKPDQLAPPVTSYTLACKAELVGNP